MKKRYTFFSKNWLRFGLVAALTVSTLNSDAQNGPAKMWDKTFGGNGVENMASIQQTSDGGFILGGYSTSGISGDKSQASVGTVDFWVIKLDVIGNKIWDKTFGGSANDPLYSIQQTSDGGFILGGISLSGVGGDKSQPNKGNADYWIVKIDANGNKLWDKTYGGSGNDYFRYIRQTSDGGYILCGNSESGISGDKSQNSLGGFDYWLLKLDGNGNKVWDKTIGGSGSEEFHQLQQTSDGGYILGGGSTSGVSGHKSQTSFGGYDFWIIKLNGSGNKVWDKTLGGNGSDILQSLQQTTDGGYIWVVLLIQALVGVKASQQ